MLPYHFPRLRGAAGRGGALAACAATALLSGCTGMLVPYLDPKPLNVAALCGTASGGGTLSCDGVARFKRTQAAINAVQVEVHDSYADRARINSVTSALAFPLAGWALYRGVNPGGDRHQDQLLKWGLVVGAGYEAKNALMSGSPEAVYLLGEARLSCVLDESARYRLDFPPETLLAGCATDARELDLAADAVEQLILQGQSDDGVRAKATALTAAARAAVARFDGNDAILQAASDAMLAAARHIVSDTNAALKSPSLSLTQATPLMQSQMANFKAVKSDVPFDPNGAKAAGSHNTQQLAKLAGELATRTNKFGRSCLPSQPSSTAGFASCNTYSPTAPPIPQIMTTLAEESPSMEPGSKLSFIATSTPSGTPWATFAGDDTVARGALSAPQLITLSPNQTQVTLSYTSAVPADSKVVLSLMTLGVTGNAKPVEITLRAAKAAPAVQTPEQDNPAAGTAMNKTLTDAALLNKLDLPAGASSATLKGRLGISWRTICRADTDDETKLTQAKFVADVKAGKAPPTPPAYCR